MDLLSENGFLSIPLHTRFPGSAHYLNQNSHLSIFQTLAPPRSEKARYLFDSKAF